MPAAGLHGRLAKSPPGCLHWVDRAGVRSLRPEALCHTLDLNGLPTSSCRIRVSPPMPHMSTRKPVFTAHIKPGGIRHSGAVLRDRAWNGNSGPGLCEGHPGMTKTLTQL